MYWTTLSLFLLVESQLYFILSWVPFYSWIRFGVHLYLVLPGKQGSVFIYKEYIHPFLEEHERQIDTMISEGHAKAKAAGMDAVKKGIEYIRVQILGMPPQRPSPAPSRNVSYTTYLMSRFAMPSAREGLASAGTTDVFAMLGKAMQQMSYPDSTTRDEQARDLTQSGSLIPPSLSGEERNDFVNTQRERLQTLLQAFDREALSENQGATSSAQPRASAPRQPASRKSYLAPSDSTYMHKSRSESEFEDLGYETMPDPEQFRAPEARPPNPSRRESAGWSNWIWGNYGERDSVIDPRKNQ